MTVEELQQELQGALQSVKAYVDAKDSELGNSIQQNQDAISALNLDEDTLANIQQLVNELDTDTIAMINENNQKVGVLEQGLTGIKQFANQLFSLS